MHFRMHVGRRQVPSAHRLQRLPPFAQCAAPVRDEEQRVSERPAPVLGHRHAQEFAQGFPAFLGVKHQQAFGRQAGDHLARIMNVFVRLPIPNVNLIEVSELHMMLSDIESHEQVTAVCQGFLGPGISGEALCILSDSSFEDVAKILNVEGEVDDQLQLELLMDAASILIGTCLTGLAHQMDINFSQGHPIVLGQHRAITEIISMNQIKWKRTLAIELSYGLEGYNVQ